MKQIQNINISDLQNNLIYPIYEDRLISQGISDNLGFDLNNIVDKKEKAITTIHTLGKYSFDTITFIGLGLSKDITTKKIREIISLLKPNKQSIIYLNDIVVNNLDIHTITKVIVETYIISSYQERKIGHEPKEMIDLDFLYNDEDISDDIIYGQAYAQGINYARYLSDLPSNLLTPETLVKEALKLSKEYNLECTILDKDKLEEIEAGGILSVNQGSNIPAYMICLKYANGGDEPFSSVVGKGLTFDSGGYNIKSNSYGMKYDMCGGADVLGIMQILAATNAKANVYGIIPTTENLVSERAYKPQDVITTLSKKTIEIVSTDAEGRLILCDGITYAQQLGATKIIDLATLTGACVSALGNVYTGVFSNDDEFYHQFETAMKLSDEKGWRLPVDPEYFEKLKSNSADFKNSVGKPGGGASVAANFLEAFVNKGTKWIHLDIAGTADNDGTGATGAMIRSVVNVLK